MMDVRPIRTEDDYDWAIAEITRYFDNQPEVGSPDGNRFDVLATLIEAYEDKYFPIEAQDPVEAIKAHMELFNLPRQALVDVIGSKSRASEILGRKRALTVDMIYRLDREMHIPAEVLVRPYHLVPDAATKLRAKLGSGAAAKTSPRKRKSAA